MSIVFNNAASALPVFLQPQHPRTIFLWYSSHIQALGFKSLKSKSLSDALSNIIWITY